MSRLTLKLSQKDHKALKLFAVNADLSIKELLTNQITNFINAYLTLLKENQVSLFNSTNDNINYQISFSKLLASKKNTYEDYEELVTVSIELDDSLHSILKKCCELENCKLKHFIRGIILDTIYKTQL